MTTQTKIHRVLASLGISLVAGMFNPSLAENLPPSETSMPAPAARMVVTILSGNSPVGDVNPGDLQVYQGRNRKIVTAVERLSGERAGMDLFIYLDRSIDSVALDDIRPELEQFIRALPETTRVAVGDSIRSQAFTADREKTAASLMQPLRNSGTAGTWSNLLDLIRQWPERDQADQDQADRRAVLIITAGVSPEYPGSTTDDPYVEAAWRNAQIAGITMYSILTRRGNPGQPGFAMLSNAAGGSLYTAAGSIHCSVRPFLDDVNLQLANQYRITFEPENHGGAQAVQVKTDTVGGRVITPSRIYVRQNLTAAEGESASAGE
jgi:hypothetical protein